MTRQPVGTRRPDPIGLTAGLNAYEYVVGNPLSYIDPAGLFEVRAHYIKTPAGVKTQFEIDFNPLSEAPGDVALWFAKKAKRLRDLRRLLDTKAVGPRRPWEDFVECGLLDAELEDSYERWFGDRNPSRDFMSLRFLPIYPQSQFRPLKLLPLTCIVWPTG